jgi:hypothetical protein
LWDHLDAQKPGMTPDPMVDASAYRACRARAPLDQRLAEERKSPVSLRQRLVGGFVVAGVAAGLAVEKAILAEADVEHRLAETTILVAFALVLRHLALGATEFSGAGSCGHKNNVAPDGGVGNVPLVTGAPEPCSRDHRSVP